jgi:hypothetical protein
MLSYVLKIILDLAYNGASGINPFDKASFNLVPCGSTGMDPYLTKEACPLCRCLFVFCNCQG